MATLQHRTTTRRRHWPRGTRETQLVLDALAPTFGLSFSYETHLIGGCAIDATGQPLPDETLAACRSADAILLGAVGGPKWSDPNEGYVLKEACWLCARRSDSMQTSDPSSFSLN